jgi:hypothetical protein
MSSANDVNFMNQLRLKVFRGNPKLSYFYRFVVFSLLLVLSFQRYWAGLQNSYSNVPFADSWALIEGIAKSDGELNSDIFWTPHNEHRIGFVRFLYYLNYEIFHGAEFSFTILHVVSLITASYILSLSISKSIRVFQYPVFVLILSLLTFFPWNSINIIWSFQITFILSLILPMLTFIYLIRFISEKSTGSFLIFTLLNLSLVTIGGAGVAAAICLPLIALIVKCRRTDFIHIALVNSILIFFYLQGLPQSKHLDLVSLILFMPRYFLVFLGSPFMNLFGIDRTAVTDNQLLIALVFGFIGLVLILYGLKILLATRNLNSWNYINFSFILYLLMIPFLASYSRASFGVSHALTSSYLIFSSLMYALILLVISVHLLHQKSNNSTILSISKYLGIVLVTLFLIFNTNRTTTYTDDFGYYKDRAGLALMLRINDVETQASIYPVSPQKNETLRLTDWLKERNSGFTRDYFREFQVLNLRTEQMGCFAHLERTRIVNSKVDEVGIILPSKTFHSRLYLQSADFSLFLIQSPNSDDDSSRSYWGYLIKQSVQTKISSILCVKQ